MVQGGLHRNSQKRFYNQDYIYFITTVTEHRFPYFKEELFCQLFIDNLLLGKKFKNFLVYGFIILPDHVHLMLKPNGEYNISQIMFTIKKQFSHDVNRVMGFNALYSKNNEGGQTFACDDEGGQTFVRLQDDKQNLINNYQNKIKQYKNLFIKKYNQFEMPEFRWQQSFHDHVIRSEKDFYKHLNYLALNCVKHNICDDEENYKWSSLNNEFEFLLDDF